MKTYDPINQTTGWQPNLSRGEMARRALRCAVRKLSNPETPEDCRHNASLELIHWQKILDGENKTAAEA